MSRVLAKLEATGNDRRLYRVLANSDELFRPFVRFTASLIGGEALPADVREIVILYLAWYHKAEYEWYEHVDISEPAGVTDAQRAALAVGDTRPEHYTPGQHVGLMFAASAIPPPLSPERWKAAVEFWGVQGALQLLLTVGCWGGMVPLLVKSVGLRHP